LDRLDLLVHQDSKVNLDLLGKLELLALLDRKALKGILDQQDLQVLMVVLELLDQLDLLVCQDHKVKLVLLEKPVPLVPKDLKDHKERWGQQDPLELLERQDHLDQPALLVLQECEVKLEPMDKQGHLDPKDHKDLKGLKEMLDHKDLSASKVKRDQLEQQDQQDPKA